MRVVFRVDASIQIGTGHVMRCLTLSEVLRKRGAQCHFICREHNGHLLESISKLGFSISALANREVGSTSKSKSSSQVPSHAHWLGCDWRLDAQQTAEIISKQKPEWLVVDHYALDHAWESVLRNHVEKIMVIDDLADRAHDCDLLLDQNLGRKKSDYNVLVPQLSQVLIGPKYALLRPEFSALREYSFERRKDPKIRRILISMGGVDQHNVTGKVLEALETCALPADCTILVVLGKNSPWHDPVQQQAETLSWKTEVLIDIDDMAQRMADSDLAIGAAGISAWERCCLGVPSLLIILAENQRSAALQLSDAGSAYLLAFDDSLDDSLHQILGSLQHEFFKLTQVSEKARRVTSGEGSHLVVNHMSRWGNL